MKKKTKRKIIELTIKTGFIISFLLLILGGVISFKYGETSTYSAICASIWFFMTILSLFLLFRFPSALKMPKVKAHKFPLYINNFNEFIKHLDDNVKKIGYEKFQYLNNYNELTCVYYKKTRNTLEYYTVFNFDEIKATKAETFDYISDIKEEFYKSYYQGQSDLRKKDLLIETMIMWVDKENENFKEIVNSNLGNYGGLLIVGVSPSKKTIYIADEKEGGNKLLYWELRKKFLKVMHLKMKDKIKK